MLRSVEKLSSLKTAALVFAMIFMVSAAQAQFAVKTNLLYDATTTPNLGVEVGVGSRSTVNLVYGLNPWTFHHNGTTRKAKHWVLMPEYRWWLCSKFDGHFIGVHALGGEYNASNLNIPFPGAFFGGENIRTGLRDKRYQGWYAGGGFTYGYQWSLSRHWNLEAEIGAGYVYTDYKKFNCSDCGGKIGEGHTNYLGLTKLGLSFIYIF